VTDPSAAAELVSEYWGTERKRARPVSWLEHPIILNRVHARVTGNPSVSTHQWFKNAFFPQPAELCLSLGCGFGAFERMALAIGISKRFHASDISSGAIEAARKAAHDAGVGDRIDYQVVDLNRVALPKASYDAVFALSSAHHVSNLENFFAQCRETLKPGGLMFLDEYIGPSRFQTPPAVTELINKLLAALPARYRKNLFTDDGSTIDRYVPSPVEHFLKHDPSEAVRSQEIVGVLKDWFDIVEFRPYGGAIQHMLLSGITGNFDETSECDAILLGFLSALEEGLEAQGIIDTDFAAIVARPKARLLRWTSLKGPYRRLVRRALRVR
jgi:2-polyprenyl-3-methyl-5-hydroxy-6-metoxy-1,4-benzoquinol methylase